MKKLLFLLLLCLPGLLHAQEYELLKSFNGIEVYYKMQVIKETKKKKTYFVEIMYKNVTDSDLYYNGRKEVSPAFLSVPESISYSNDFCYVDFVSAGQFAEDTGMSLFGDSTNFEKDGTQIRVIPKGKEFYRTAQYVVKAGREPIINVRPYNSVTFRTVL